MICYNIFIVLPLNRKEKAMSFFRRKPRPEPEPVPDVFVQHIASLDYTVSRFFFAKDWLMVPQEPTREGSRVTMHSDEFRPNREAFIELRKQLFDATSVMGRDWMTDSIRPYPQYLAIQWSYSKLPEGESPGEATARIEESIVAILAAYFGWSQPLVGHFATDVERKAKAIELGASWQLGSYHPRPTRRW